MKHQIMNPSQLSLTSGILNTLRSFQSIIPVIMRCFYCV